ncbi:MAG: DUF2828 family protein, partial [Mycoplasma sp.]
VWNTKMSMELVQYQNDLFKGEIKANVSVLQPVDIYNLGMKDANSANALWTQQERLSLSFFPIIDVSGSMYGLPSRVANSLGIYVAEQNQGIFKNKAIIFSNDTKEIELDGRTFLDNYSIIERNNVAANTNLDKVFENLFEKTLIEPQALPKGVIIFSDCQFDSMVSGWDTTIYKKWTNKFEGLGVAMPKIVYWNINGQEGTFPVQTNDKGAILMSGYSIHSLKTLEKVCDSSAENIMLEVMEEELKKYNKYF